MKKIRFIITFIYFALITFIVILTVFFVFRATRELTELYFKNYEVNQESRLIKFTLDDVDRVINILRTYKLI